MGIPAIVNVIKGGVKIAYLTAASHKSTRKIMERHTAREGGLLSGALNSAIGTTDALQRMQLFFGNRNAVRLAQTYIAIKGDKPNLLPLARREFSLIDEDARQVASDAFNILVDLGYEGIKVPR